MTEKNTIKTPNNESDHKAIVPLNTIKLDEVIAQTNALEIWLNSCGGSSIYQFGNSQIPMMGNLLAVLGSLIDLFTAIQAPKADKLDYRKQVGYLGINLLGTIPAAPGKAQGLMALRPILAHYAEKKKS